MICVECRHDDRKQLEDSLSCEQVLHTCKTYRCARCAESPEQTQARLTKEADQTWKASGKEVAHDWAGIVARRATS